MKNKMLHIAQVSDKINDRCNYYSRLVVVGLLSA